MALEIKNLHVSINGNKILKGINLEVKRGEVVALMGPNGSGKSTLALTLMGHPNYKIEEGRILFNGKDITEMQADERAKLGLFLSFQYPHEVNGVSMANFLRTALNSKLQAAGKEKINVFEFKKLLHEKLEFLKIPKEFAERYVNEGFSGGEKKRAEILQLAVLKPEIAILDETDSGLDIDALRVVANGVNQLMSERNKESKDRDLGVLIITHYQRILNYIKPDRVHIMIDGKIVKSGSSQLAEELEAKGYEEFVDKTNKTKGNK